MLKMTRKGRKQERKHPPLTINKGLDKLLHQMAKLVAQLPPALDEGHRFYCPECKRDWGRPFGMPYSSTFCKECHYKGCEKEAEKAKLCAYCERRQNEDRKEL